MSKICNLNVGEVVSYLEKGKKLSRTHWNDKKIYIQLQVPDEYSKMNQPYVFITNENTGAVMPYTWGMDSLLASDWFIL